MVPHSEARSGRRGRNHPQSAGRPVFGKQAMRCAVNTFLPNTAGQHRIAFEHQLRHHFCPARQTQGMASLIAVPTSVTSARMEVEKQTATIRIILKASFRPSWKLKVGVL